MARKRTAGDYARFALAGVRMFNGTAALVAPGQMGKNLGADPDASPGLQYVFRMFGIRTVVIAAELLVSDRHLRPWAVKLAPVIHVTDAVAAATAGLNGNLPRRAAIVTTAISTTNAVLAFVAARDARRRE